MIAGFDHVVILADQLSAAVRRYQALGFHVEPGGIHPAWGTENALIPLEGGAYLELLAPQFPSRPRPPSHLWWRADGSPREPGEYGGYALGSNDLLVEVSRCNVEETLFTEPQVGSRMRPDGQMVRWRAALPTLPTLPFLIQDESPRELRISPPQNGVGAAVRLSEITVSVPNLAVATRAYSRLLGDSPADDGTGSMRFRVPGGTIRLVQPALADPAKHALGRVNFGVSTVTLTVRRWMELTHMLARVLIPQGDGALIDPHATGGPQILLLPGPGARSPSLA